MTIRMYADHKNIQLEHVEVSLSHARDYIKDASNATEPNQKIELLQRKIQLVGPLSNTEKHGLWKSQTDVQYIEHYTVTHKWSQH